MTRPPPRGPTGHTINFLAKLLENHPLVGPDQQFRVIAVAEAVSGVRYSGPEFVPQSLVLIAVDAVSAHLREQRLPGAKELADGLPVRKAVVGDEQDGGARYYWRVVDDKGGVHPGVKDAGKNRGTLAMARAKAADLHVRGIVPVELVPPDLDPKQLNADDWTENRAKSQPDGMTVRMRTKRH